ncbi:B- and T-lymphocyte attenuator isoform X2 [Myiozetetes cayanensis]|uniref:B- and T-lymphocyte attenuator isoform X2 n=1 Tax=Myiozetetes cayanensis TaxID=478635 RepID=UPI00215DFA4E|nr:B- and T-lymphocyte attenuator isoform X2 [Myiozetetes cayanensis]
MKVSPVMLLKRTLLNLLPAVLAQSISRVHGSDEAGDCSAEIHVPSRSRYRAHVGGSLSLECPVRYCQTKPLLQWCRMEGATCVQLERGQAGWKSDSVFALEISPVHRNDTGRFRCQAKGVNFSIESHEIKVIVEDTTRISEESQQSGDYNILHIIYASAPVGLCLFIIGCTFWCLKRCHAKQKRTPLAQQRQESLVRSPAAAPPPGAGTAQASEESPSLYCPMASPPQALKDNAIYDNDVPPWNAQRRALHPPCSFPGVPSIPVLPESPDALTYAALNHSAPAGRWQRRERAPVNEVTEYASINVHR